MTAPALSAGASQARLTQLVASAVRLVGPDTRLTAVTVTLRSTEPSLCPRAFSVSTRTRYGPAARPVVVKLRAVAASRGLVREPKDPGGSKCSPCAAHCTR